ncbi:hypothetical protein [Paenibacillus sp. J22TS3]|uniref:hypothetical protein n=1 Tax=Paenibacillus sp. J22TS3 TaxID=2807192 RepID=UPI001B1BD92A|nr:hypothetical protein [Paenibacillus sp. J22TS3]GIP23282.1 hypothetical protein J22TS3_35570 [Paenibacillus sp. J22TS3]
MYQHMNQNFAEINRIGADLRGASLEGFDFKSFSVTGVKKDSGQCVLLARSYGPKVV